MAELPQDKKCREEWRAHWSKKYGRELSEAELEDIYRNFVGFFQILWEWRCEDKAKAAEQAKLQGMGDPAKVTP